MQQSVELVQLKQRLVAPAIAIARSSGGFKEAFIRYFGLTELNAEGWNCPEWAAALRHYPEVEPATASYSPARSKYTVFKLSFVAFGHFEELSTGLGLSLADEEPVYLANLKL